MARSVKYPEFQEELAKLLNKYSLDNHAGTPDFILANYLTCQLETYAATSRVREQWFGRPPGRVQVQLPDVDEVIAYSERDSG